MYHSILLLHRLDHLLVLLQHLQTPLQQHLEVALVQQAQVRATCLDLLRRQRTLLEHLARLAEAQLPVSYPLCEYFCGFGQHANRVGTQHEVLHVDDATQREAHVLVVALRLTRQRRHHVAVALLCVLLVEEIHLRRLALHLLEREARVQQLRVHVVRSLVVLVVRTAGRDHQTHHEDLGRLVSRCGRLRRLHLLEQLIEDVDERVVVRRAEDLRHERAALVHELHRQTQRVQHQRVLRVMVNRNTPPDRRHPCPSLHPHSGHHRVTPHPPTRHTHVTHAPACRATPP